MLISFDHKAIFVHAPKTGGMSIRHTLWQHFDFVRPPGLTDWHSGFIPTSEAEPTYGYGGYGGWLIFGVVRNPYERMVSFWRHCVDERDNPLWRHVWQRADDADTFSGFVANLLRDGTPQAFPPMTHTLRQCNRVLRFEHLQAEFNTLPFVRSAVVLPVLNNRDHSCWRDMYDGDTMELVRCHYREDFERYGY